MTHTRITPSSSPERDPGEATSSGWEAQYFDGLAAKGALSSEARAEIAATLDRVFQHIPAPVDAPDSQRVVGALVGAIQSGKTGVMIGLAARALDLGFRIVLVLAGLRDDLRTQTALRFVTDLLHRGDQIYPREGESRFTHPSGRGYHGTLTDSCWSPHYSEDVNHDEAFTTTLKHRILGGGAALVIAKKNLATLNKMRDAIAYVSRQCGPHELPLLVVDDECDEATVSGTSDAPTPDRIVGVWEDLKQYVAYAGLTATPAANLLQETGAALFPRDFVEVLRVPGSESSILTIEETDPDRRYTGGEAFYRFLEAHERDNFLVRPEMSDAEFRGTAGHNHELEEALIAYFVSGAIRLASADGCSLSDPSRLPLPHTMLAHTDVQMQGHWDLCMRVVSATRQHGGEDGTVNEDLRPMRPSQRLNPAHLLTWLSEEHERWSAWYDDFRASQQVLLEISPDRDRPSLPDWARVKEALREVFEHTKLRVINSDDAASDPPLSFRPTYGRGGRRAPIDVYSIIIGGNRLSRGLTIEGLCISYYTRSSAILVEDSTVQRERWFGYRGPHLEYCRLFTHRDLDIRLVRFHEHDEDLRRQLAWNLSHGRGTTDSTLRFLRLRDSRPTSKLGRGITGTIDIAGSRVFFDRVQMGGGEDHIKAAQWNQNQDLNYATRLIGGGEEIRNPRGGELTAYVIRDRSASEVSDCLDAFRFTFHNPDPASGVQVNLRDFYRSPCPELSLTERGLPESGDPYLLAAYLRFWANAYQVCETNPAENRFRAHDTVSDWAPCRAPRFNLALRVGLLKPDSGPFAHKLQNRSISSNGELGSRWGGRGYGSDGDEWIDMPPPNGEKEAPRSQGSPGLALLHIISREAVGRSGGGEKYVLDRPTFALVVPEGGPCVEFVLASP